VEPYDLIDIKSHGVIVVCYIFLKCLDFLCLYVTTKFSIGLRNFNWKRRYENKVLLNK